MSVSMRLITAVEIAANAAERWRKQYQDWRAEDMFADGTTKASHDHALNNCEHTPENIARILNNGWAYPQCSFCGNHYQAVVEMKDEWASDSEQICLPCLNRAKLIFSQSPSASESVE